MNQTSSLPYQPQGSWASGWLVPPLQTQRSQAPGQPCVSDVPTTEEGSVASPRALSIKIKQLQVLSGKFGWKMLLLDNETGTPQWPEMPPPLSASSENWGSNLYSFICFLSLDHDCYVHTANQVLRFYPTCRRSWWLETKTQVILL